MSRALHLTAPLAYDAMIGVGGIGSGTFFALSGNRTLGREESRAGRFLDRRDYCKLHIIAHYVRTLLGPAFTALPIGRVGDDDRGRQLLSAMSKAGIDARYVETAPGEPTLFSFCFLYPDGSGGNLTTENSACARLDAAGVTGAGQEFARFGARAIALAVPEAPLDARIELLKLATAQGSFRAASFASGEIAAVLRAGLVAQLDLLALNLDEAATVAGTTPDPACAEQIVFQAAERLHRMRSGLCLAVTAGKRGSWMTDGAFMTRQPVYDAPVAGTAGAGDAFLSGMLAAWAAGLSAAEAHELGALTASFAVTSPHTIHPGLDRDGLRKFAASVNAKLAPRVQALLGPEVAHADR